MRAGKILDGWNRYRACQQLGINAPYEPFIYDDIAAMRFVMRTNKRRNLTSSQWAQVAVEAEEIIEDLKGRAKERQEATYPKKGVKGFQSNVVEKFPQHEEADSGKTREKVADRFNTNPRYISDAEKLKKAAPDLGAHIKDGTITIANAKALLKAGEATRQAVIAKVKAGEKSQSWQEERLRIQEEANRKRSEAAKAQPRAERGVFSSGAATSCGTTVQASQEEKTKQPERTSSAKAAASKTNRGSVERMDSLARERPDLAERMAILL